MLLRINHGDALYRFSFGLPNYLHCCEVQLRERLLPDHRHCLVEGLLGEGDEVNLLTRDSVLLGGVITDHRLQQPHQHLDGDLPAVEIYLTILRMRNQQNILTNKKLRELILLIKG